MVLLGWHDERILRALVRHAQNAGWQMETRHFFDETLPHGWSGDGMLVSSPIRPNLLRFMIKQAPMQPTVLLERNHPAKLRVAAQVHEDNMAAGRLAAAHLLTMGHKHFVWWTSARGPVPDERLAGFRETLVLAGCDCETLEYQTSRINGEWRQRRAWLRKRLVKLPRPVALFAMDDQLAAEAIEMCLECSLKVPQDVAVVGVGNLELASATSHVPITSVDNAADEIALAGARLLDRMMAGGRAPERPVVIAPRGLVARQSSAALAVTHPILLRAIHCLRANLAQSFDPQRLVAETGVSESTLYKLFRAELRCTPVEFLHREQMSKAKAMLESGNTSTKELLRACGFGTVRTLNRLFLRHEGCSPRVWHRQERNG